MQKKQPTREKLLNITFDEVYIHGYTATSVDTILKKAGIPKGSMYHHFKGKKELYIELNHFSKIQLKIDYEELVSKLKMKFKQQESELLLLKQQLSAQPQPQINQQQYNNIEDIVNEDELSEEEKKLKRNLGL